MKISCCGGMFFFCFFVRSSENELFWIPGPSGNRTANQSKLYLETIGTVLNLFSDKIRFLSLTEGLTRKIL